MTAAARPASPTMAWYAVAVLTLAYLLSLVDRIILTLLVDPIQRDLGINDTQFGLLHGFAFALLYAFAGVPIARLADVSPRRWVIAIGVLAWSAMTALCALAANFWQLFLCRLGVGVGEAALSPASNSMMADMFPRDRLGRAIAVFAAGGVVGGGLALIIGGFMLQLFPAEATVRLPLVGAVHGWQLIFLVLGVPGVAVALLVLTIVEPQRRTAPSHAASSMRALAGFLGGPGKVLGLHFLGFSCLSMVKQGFLAWAPSLLIRKYDADPSQVGYALGSAAVVAGVAGVLAGGLTADWLVRRGRDDAHFLVGLAAAVVLLPVMIAAPLANTYWASLGLLTLVNFFGFYWSAAATAGLQLASPPALRAQTTALYILFFNLVGFGLGPVAVGFVTDTFGSPTAIDRSMAMVAAVMLPVVILLLVLARRPFARLVGQRRAAELEGGLS